MKPKTSLITALTEEGIGLVDMPQRLAEATLIVEEKWLKFIEQPFAQKKLHVPQAGGGYEYRGPTAVDHKETFHVTLGYEPPAASSSIDHEYIHAAKNALVASFPLITNFAEGIADMSEVSEKIKTLMLERYEHWVLRSVRYFPLTAKEIEDGKITMAASHVDKGHTFHLHESAAGFMKFWKGSWHKVDPQRLVAGADMQVVTYGGLNTQYYTQCDIVALCHGVNYTPYTELHGRTSQLLFVDFGSVVYDKPTWGSTQEQFPAGENYDMPWPIFSGYFTEKKL